MTDLSKSSTLTAASHQWATRPNDERFTSLITMRDHFETIRSASASKVIASNTLSAFPDEDNKGLYLAGPGGHKAIPTNWAFNQVTKLAGGPGGYLAKLPSPLAADCINYGLHVARDVEDVGVLLHQNGHLSMRAATGPQYGRIWNVEILRALVNKFGDGITGDWTVPGEFGKAVDVTKANTTLFAGDRDMFVFLADETNRIVVPNRRNGQSGSLARGFFVWNSEVGSSVFGLAMFLFDYACCNRIVWGAEQYKEIRIRHTASAPEKFLEEIQPALISYAHSSTKSVDEAIANARAARVADKLDDFLATRFGKSRVEPMKAVHVLEEGRPIETVWDATVAATAYARSIKWQDDRVTVERQAGELLKLASK